VNTGIPTVNRSRSKSFSERVVRGSCFIRRSEINRLADLKHGTWADENIRVRRYVDDSTRRVFDIRAGQRAPAIVLRTRANCRTPLRVALNFWPARNFSTRSSR